MSQFEKSSSGVTVELTQSELMVRQFSIRYSGTTLAQPNSSATVECWGGVFFLPGFASYPTIFCTFSGRTIFCFLETF